MPATLTDNALTILKKRYFCNGEGPSGLWDRVSGGNPRFRRLLDELYFVPNSPTLFNAGLNNGGTLSACFVFDVADSLRDGPDSILGTRDKAAAVAKAGGGVGYYFGNLRAKGSLVRSVHRKACGPVAVLRDYHSLRQLITQGGKRDLAQMAVLPVWHPDVEEFIHSKDEDPKSLESFNISVSWPEKFATQATAVPGDPSFSVGAKSRDLWRKQCNSAWTTGCPGMFFPDRVNRDNPNKHLGMINAPNPCGETPNRSDEPCSLASIALQRMFDPANRDVNWKLLEEVVWTGTEFMDDILDRNVFPHPDIDRAARLTRKLGLGVMGWAELLALLHIKYSSEEAIKLADRVASFIKEVSLGCRRDMAKRKGPYPGFDETKTEAECLRNETGTSIAPTGTIAIIAGCRTWSIEPFYAEANTRTTNEGIVMEERMGEYEGFVPETALEVPLEWHVRHQAAWQKHVELGVSKTINLPNSATPEDISRAYKMMYDLGCKGGTVYRDGCRSEQVLVSKKKSVYSLPSADGLGVEKTRGAEKEREDVSVTILPTLQLPPAKRRLPGDRSGTTHKVRIGGVPLFLTANTFEDGSLAEIFINTSKVGSSVAGLITTWAINFSIALQNGTPLADLCHHHIGTHFEPCGLTSNKNIPHCSSIPDYVCRYLKKKFLGDTPDTGVNDSGQFCPECGAPVVYQAGCLVCVKPGCGWSKCG